MLSKKALRIMRRPQGATARELADALSVSLPTARELLNAAADTLKVEVAVRRQGTRGPLSTCVRVVD